MAVPEGGMPSAVRLRRIRDDMQKFAQMKTDRQTVKIPDVLTFQEGPGVRNTQYTNSGVKLLNVANLVDGKVDLSTSDRYVSAQDAYGKYKHFLCSAGDFIVASSGIKVEHIDRKMGFIEESMLPLCMNTGTIRFRVLDPERLRIRYFMYYLKSRHFKEQLDRYITGSAQFNFGPSHLKKMEMPIADLREQDELIGILDSVSAIISLRRQEILALDRLIKARFAELFGDPITNQKGFPVYRTDAVVEFQGGSQPNKKFFTYQPAGDTVRLIQIRDYKTDRFITYIPKAMAKRFCTAEDIMIGRYGPPVFQILQGIAGAYNVALIKAVPKMGNREFIRYYLKQDCLRQYLESLSKRTAGQDGVQMDKLKAYPFLMPPIELQEQFAALVKQVDASKALAQKALNEAQTLFDSLIQKYFGTSAVLPSIKPYAERLRSGSSL